jgi:hypothetical protein
LGIAVLVLLTGLLCITNRVAAQEVKLSVVSPAEVRIRIDSIGPGREWSFRNAYAGVLGIAERVEQFRAFGHNGEDAGARKIATGEFRSNSVATDIEYVVRLPAPDGSSVSHVTWISGESGLLMLADLLPYPLPAVDLEISLPPGWSCLSVYAPGKNGKYQVPQPEETVLLIGRELRREAHRVGALPFDVAISGEWQFKSEVAKAATKVFGKYLALTNSAPVASPLVMIAPLPVATGSVKWRAETRGRTVVLLMDPAAKINNWTGQFGVIFTHELLHLWVPGSLMLEGDYDWFFEGFTLYTALVTSLELKFISANEFVATLRRVYDSYLSRPDELSLIDASERRWTTGNLTVYDKGMLVAFLYDLAIRRNSRGKMWLGNLYKELFARRATQPANGNEVIIQLLSSTPAGADLAKSYIEGQRELDLERLFADQKQLLKSLYYPGR